MSAAEMREALKPCPFCGGAAELYESDTVAGVICERDNSHSVVVSRSKDASGEAVSAWNRRAPLPDEEGMVEAALRKIHSAQSLIREYLEDDTGTGLLEIAHETLDEANVALRAINGAGHE